MARTPMVTRTITATKANVMCLEVQKGEPCNISVTVPRTYKDDETLLKVVKPLIELDNPGVKAVYVTGKDIIETLYGMTEQEFMKYAKALPPRGQQGSPVTEE